LRIRALRFLVACVICLVLAPGCSEPPHGIVVWHSYRGAEQAALKKVVERFEKEKSTIVTLLFVPYDAYLAKLEAAIPRGNGPDVFLGPHNRLGEYLLNILVAPVGDALPEEDVALYEPQAVEAITYEGKRYAVPLASKCVALYVNTKLLPQTPATLDEIAKKKSELPGSVRPLAYEWHSAYYHAALLHAYGGRFFDNGFAMTGKEAEAAAAKLKELVDAEVVPRDVDGDRVTKLFASGKAATVISGPWLAAELKGDLTYLIAPLPRVEGAGKMRAFLGVDGAFLTPEGAKRDAARAFARYLGSEASAKERAETGKQVVATKAYWSTPSGTTKRSKPDAGDDVLRAFHDASADAVPMPASMKANPAWVPAEQALRKIVRSDTTPKAALDEAKARYDDALREPPAAPTSKPVFVAFGIAILVIAIMTTRRVTAPGFRQTLRKSFSVYRYIAHAAITIFVLVVLPLLAGAATSFFAGTRDAPRFVGLANYVEILTARGQGLLSHGSFYLTLLVTVVWTVGNVAFHVSLGLLLGVALARPYLKLRAIYRVLLIVPWAVPSYVTGLAWKGMFNFEYGAVNAILTRVGAAPVSWFGKFSTAFAANVSTNVWLGFPFMMVVVMGALTSIPKDVLEAAEVDGATRWQTFRLVTLPLLRPTLLPAVVLGTIWTFNQFNVVFLVSGGEPDGTTDILISEAYRWAFAKNAQFGYAAAYAVIIFGLLVLMSRVLGRIGGEAKG